MKWNDEKGYITFQSSMYNLKSFLGIGTLDIIERCELLPYYTYILNFLSSKLILLGPDATMSTKLQEVFNIFDWGTDLILAHGTLDLAWALGIETTDYYIEGVELPYDQEYLVFAWSNAMTALSVRLKLQYSHLLYQSTNTDCHSCNNGCSVGLTTNDLENWKSGVYPEDEEYTAVTTTSGNSWRVNSDITECTKCQRG